MPGPLRHLPGRLGRCALPGYEIARQIIGRAMRPKMRDNPAHVVWFWDRQSSVFSKGFRKVLEKLESTEGFTCYHPCAGRDSVVDPMF